MWGGIPLHNAVGINCKNGPTTKIKTRVPGIWAKGLMLHNMIIYAYSSLMVDKSKGILFYSIIIITFIYKKN